MSSLAETQRDLIESAYRILGPPRLRNCPLRPSPRQEAFLLPAVLEAFYGGAAGGGKSLALLMAALQYSDVPGYAALLLRPTLAELQLAGGLIELRTAGWPAPARAGRRRAAAGASPARASRAPAARA
jgi:hypothetical protein